MTLAQMIGQRLVVGFQGYTIPNELVELVKKTHIGNIILFAENIQSKAQLKTLCTDLQTLIQTHTGYPAFITIDQEGGVVSRLGDDCAVVPSAMCISATGDPHNAYMAGKITATELSALGVNFNLAPDVDVNSNAQNPVIGVRSYGDTPETVSTYAAEMIRGLNDGGVYCSAKHFPGHGDTDVDSHMGLPVVNKSLEELEACELFPFRKAIQAGVTSVMTTHILFPQLEAKKIPATMSRNIITGLLKEKMQFKGLVISDCMMMGAIQTYYGTVKGIVAAVHAGVDLVFSCHSMTYIEQASVAIQEAIDKGEMSLAEMEASVQKILHYKKQLPPSQQDIGIVGCKEHRMQVDQMMQKGITLVQGTCPNLGDSPLFLGCHPYRPTQASNPENTALSFAHFLQKTLGGTAIATPIDPTQEDIETLCERAKKHSAIVMGTYNGHIKKGQIALALSLSQLHLPIVCVALRNPYDLFHLPSHVTAIAAYQYDDTSLRAVADVLAQKYIPTATLPIQGGKNHG